MASGESPAVARRRLRLALRKAREDKKLTQGQVAESLYWSLSKVQRIESGDVTVSATDVQALLGVYGVSDSLRIDAMVEDARAARRRGWWDDPAYREHLTPATMELLQFESEASTIRYFSAAGLPGIVQTPEFARTMIESWSAAHLSEEDRAARLEVRMLRRRHVFERPDPPEFRLLLDESALLRVFGGVAITADQMRTLLDHVDRGSIVFRVLPFGDPGGAVTIMTSPFIVLDIDDRDNSVLYRESFHRDEMTHAPVEVMRFREQFDRLWDHALDTSRSRLMLDKRCDELQRQLD